MYTSTSRRQVAANQSSDKRVLDVGWIAPERRGRRPVLRVWSRSSRFTSDDTVIECAGRRGGVNWSRSSHDPEQSSSVGPEDDDSSIRL